MFYYFFALPNNLNHQTNDPQYLDTNGKPFQVNVDFIAGFNHGLVEQRCNGQWIQAAV